MKYDIYNNCVFLLQKILDPSIWSDPTPNPDISNPKPFTHRMLTQPVIKIQPHSPLMGLTIQM